MPRSIFFRVKGSQDWERVTLTSNPFEVSGYAQGTVFEIDDGTGIVQEVTTLLAPRVISKPTMTPAFGPVGTLFTVTRGQYEGTEPITVTGILRLNGVDVTSQMVGNSYTSTATGSVLWTETTSNGVLPNVVETVLSSVVVIPSVTAPISNQQMIVGDPSRTINLASHFANASTYTVSPIGQGATISGSNLTIVTTAARSVTYTIVGTSVDNYSTDLNFSTVISVPVITPTVTLAIPDVSMYIGDTTRTINLGTHFGNAVTYSVSPVGQGVTVSGSNLIIAPTAERNANFTVTATSSTGHTVTDVFNLIITVNPAANDSAQLTAVKSIFAGGRKGAIYEVNMANCFRDAAGTQPVTAIGQDVMHIRDISGNGMHLSQTDATRAMVYDVSNGKPALRRKNASSTLNRSVFATDNMPNMTVTVGARKLTNTFATVMVFGQDITSTVGSFEILHGTATGDSSRRNWGTNLRGSADQIAASAMLYDGDTTNVITAQMDFNAPTVGGKVAMRIGGIEQDETYLNDSGSATFTPARLSIGSRPTSDSASTGYFYGAVLAAGTITVSQLAAMEAYVNSITFTAPTTTLTSLRAEQDGFSVIAIESIRDLTFTPNEDGFSVAGF